MGRSKKFDDDTVVRPALDVFWSRGHVATSLTDLLAATGVSKSSFDEAFGNKRGLFDRAMSHYLERIIGPLFAPLESRGAGTPQLLAYFRGFADRFRDQPAETAGRGCFMLTTATELNELDEIAANRVRSYRLRMRAAFRNALSGAGLGEDEAGTRADALTATHIGLMITSRVDLPAAAALARSVEHSSSGSWRTDRAPPMTRRRSG